MPNPRTASLGPHGGSPSAAARAASPLRTGNGSSVAQLAAWLVAGLVSAPALGQQRPDPVPLPTPGAATVYTEESIGDVDPRGVSTRWVDPGQASDLMKDRVVRTRPLTPAEAAASGLNPRLGATRGFAYRAPGVRATFHRPAYITLTLDGPRVNGSRVREGDFREIIPPDTVFDMTTPPVPPAELTEFSAGMLIDGRIDLSPGRLRAAASPAAIAETAAPAAPRKLQPWVRLETDASGRVRLAERATVDEKTEAVAPIASDR